MYKKKDNTKKDTKKREFVFFIFSKEDIEFSRRGILPF